MGRSWPRTAPGPCKPPTKLRTVSWRSSCKSRSHRPLGPQTIHRHFCKGEIIIVTVVIVAFIIIVVVAVVVDVNGTDRDCPKESVEGVNYPSTSRGRGSGRGRNMPCGKGGGGGRRTWTVSARCSSSTDTHMAVIFVPRLSHSSWTMNTDTHMAVIFVCLCCCLPY